ncbi:DUF402 domain-containing protein [Spiroplasma endosymbiont of Aspidapion aeneum]|uniref:DUF402 domain-containing protein n=1 Tax=Spiroplasma endosymbiont of Aspidapion aeneum TaxID=3066276 RepID=UPI00313DE3DC
MFEAIEIKAYKNDNKLSKIFSNGCLLYEDDEQKVFASNNYSVIEDGKKTFINKGKEIWFFPKNKLFNIMWFLEQNKTLFFINIASPISDKNIYIDYDIDIKVNKDGQYQILDLANFNKNRFLYKYDETIVNNVWDTVDELKKIIKNKEKWFNKKYLENILKNESVYKWINQE